MIHSLLHRTHRILARSRATVRLAATIRRQCEHIIREHMYTGYDVRHNGEAWFAGLIAPTVEYFIDVGGNVGDWTAEMLSLAKQGTKGIIFEPSASACKLLRKRFGTAASVELIEAAASDRVGEATFFEEPEAGFSSSLGQAFTRPGAVSRVVRITTLATEMERRGWPRVDLMKVDAEGYDLYVLRGSEPLLRGRRIGVVQFEYQNSWATSGATLRAAIDLLERDEYTVFLLRGHGLYKINYKTCGEYFGYSNYVAVAPDRMHLIDKHIVGRV